MRDIFNQVNPDVLGSDLYARRTCRAIVSNSRTKARCARALCVFTESLPAEEACDIVYEALTHDDFLDTTGNMLSFYLQVQQNSSQPFATNVHDIPPRCFR